MTSPTPDYHKYGDRIHKIIDKVDLGGFVTEFEFSEEAERTKTPKMEKGSLSVQGHLPNIVTFYQDNKKMGAVHFLKDPVVIEVLDSSFKPYAGAIRKEYGL